MSYRVSSVRTMTLVAVIGVALLALAHHAPADAAPSGQMTWAVHISLAPTWFDPAETPSLITPFMVLYAMHDALVKPMPGAPQGKSLAEAWSVSKDGLVYEFVLRNGVTFHNGEPVTAEDVKFSFERYKGAGAKLLKDRVAAVEIVDRQKVRFRLHKPWLDVYNTYPEIDGLFSEQVNEQNPRVRTQILQKIQQILHDRAMFAPVLEPAFLNGVGPKVANSGLGNTANFPYSAPLEDLTLKAK